MENKTVKIIKSLIDLVGVTAGIVISSVGAIMFLNAVFNLYVFQISEPRYAISDEYECAVFDVDKIEAQMLTGVNAGPVAMPLDKNATAKQGKELIKLSKEQKNDLRKKYEKCKKDLEEKNQKLFETDQKRSMATGLSFMIVGFPLLYFYQRKKKGVEKEGV